MYSFVLFVWNECCLTTSLDWPKKVTRFCDTKKLHGRDHCIFFLLLRTDMCKKSSCKIKSTINSNTLKHQARQWADDVTLKEKTLCFTSSALVRNVCLTCMTFFSFSFFNELNCSLLFGSKVVCTHFWKKSFAFYCSFSRKHFFTVVCRNIDNIWPNQTLLEKSHKSSKKKKLSKVDN